MLETALTALRRTVSIMEKSQQTDSAGRAAPTLLAHLEQAFGWSEGQAIDALGAYMMSTEAGQALRHELASSNRNRRAA